MTFSPTTPRTKAQLALGLIAELPALTIEPEWKLQRRLWGHSFHPMCSYLASFPAALAHAFIARYSRPGDVVLDPFSGRGTTPLQACAEGRVGVGNDLNPLAHLLTAAKVEPPSYAEAIVRLTQLRVGWSREADSWEALATRVQDQPTSPDAHVPPVPREERNSSAPDAAGSAVPAEVAIAFHPFTFGQLLFAREQLRLDDPVDRFLAGAAAGILHGKSQSYLSEIMPNSFSMAPRYVRTYSAATAFSSPRRDVFECLGLKLERLYRQPPPSVRGIALLGDARTCGGRAVDALRSRGLPDRARLIVTSPPYLRVVKYGYYNWLRTWLLGMDAAAIDRDLDDAHHRAEYLIFLREVLGGLRSILTSDGIIVLVVGDVERDRGRPINTGLGLAGAVWEHAARPEGYVLAGVGRDEVDAGRKLTKVWGDEAGRATRIERILVLATSETGRRRAVASSRLPIDWTWPPTRTRLI